MVSEEVIKTQMTPVGDERFLVVEEMQLHIDGCGGQCSKTPVRTWN